MPDETGREQGGEQAVIMEELLHDRVGVWVAVGG
jgi:hypothetical protein